MSPDIYFIFNDRVYFSIIRKVVIYATNKVTCIYEATTTLSIVKLEFVLLLFLICTNII